MLISRIDDGEIIAPGEGVDVFLRPSPLRQERHHVRLAAGLSVAEMLRECDAAFDMRGNFERLHVSIGGHAIPEENWSRLRVKPGATVNIVRVPGKGALRSIVSAIVAIVALVVAPYLAAPIIGGLGLTGAAATAVTGLIAAGITYAASIAINALFPVAKPEGQAVDNTKTLYSIGGGQNESIQYGAIPEIFGEHRISPPKAAGDYTEIVGDDQYLRMLFVVGYGPIEVSDLKIAETPIATFEGISWEVIEDHTVTSPTLYTRPVYEESVSVLLDFPSGWVQRTTADGVDEISIDASFPNGVYSYRKSDGNRVNYTVTIEVQYAVAGTGSWVPLGSISITAASAQAVRRSLSAAVARGQYDIRMRKTAPEYVGEDTVSETAYWTAVRGRRNENVINFPKPLTLIAVRVKATNQLNGSVNQLNCIARPKIRAFNGSSWVAGQTTRIPADHFRQVLQGNANARPVADGVIDLDSIERWWEFCQAEGFKFDLVATEQVSIYDRLTQIAAAGRASVTFRDAKWGVVWDEADTPIVQHFTPRNSWGFSSVRGYVDMPHGFRVPFINRENGYLNDERVVYDDGYTAANATKFEGLDFPGITHPALIWRHGRYHIAQLRLQRESYSLNTDWEHLVCTRGDRVRVNHDVVLWGIGAARVKQVLTSPERVLLDDTMAMEAGKTYSIRFRKADGSSITRTVAGVDGEFTEIVFSDAGSLPEAGDLAQFGEFSLESVVLRVKAITPQADLTAKIELVDDAPGILQADTGTIPPFQTGIAPIVNYASYAPTDLQAVETIWTTSPPTSLLTLTWAAPDVGSVASYLVQYKANNDGNWTVVPVASATSSQIADLSTGVYQVRVRAVFANGQLSGWRTITVVVSLFGSAPADVENFRVAINGDNATLQWSALSDPVVSHYQIRFSPNLVDVTWQAASRLRDNITTAQAQVPAMVGTYLIKAVNYAGLVSNSPALIVSTVDPLTAFNAVESLEEAPSFAGDKTDVTVVGSLLRLESGGDFFEPDDFFAPPDFFLSGGGFPSVGIYEFVDVIDLGAVYTSRVSAAITAYGALTSEDVFSRPDWFATPDFFGTAAASLWDVVVDISTTNDDPLGLPTWSPWTELVASDIAARAYMFRARLQSFQFDVTPVVSGLSVTVDMPDRVIAGNDLAVSASGLTVEFSPAFLVLSGLSIAAQGLQTGDYYEFTGKNEAGFTIIFRNAAGAAVERSFDYVAKGYGAVQ